MKQAIAIAFVAAFSSSVLAQKPVKEPLDFPPVDYQAGEVCAFPVRLDGGNTSAIIFPSGRQMLVGSGSVTVTNLETDLSIELGQSGRYSEKLLGDGTVKIETNGQQLIFLLPQDVGGPGLPLITGHAVLTYDIGTDTVTSLRLSSKSIDVCAALAQ
jgi:hypothetical protein